MRTRKTVTILFTDVVGSTTLGEGLDPEVLRRVMTTYFDHMREVLERHRGTVEKYIGDAIVAVFGIPEVHEDDALRATRAAHEMRAALNELNNRLPSKRCTFAACRMAARNLLPGRSPQRLGPPTETASQTARAAGDPLDLLGAPLQRKERGHQTVDRRKFNSVGARDPDLCWNIRRQWGFSKPSRGRERT